MERVIGTVRRSHAPSRRRNLAGSLPCRDLAVLTASMNGMPSWGSPASVR